MPSDANASRIALMMVCAAALRATCLGHELSPAGGWATGSWAANGLTGNPRMVSRWSARIRRMVAAGMGCRPSLRAPPPRAHRRRGSSHGSARCRSRRRAPAERVPRSVPATTMRRRTAPSRRSPAQPLVRAEFKPSIGPGGQSAAGCAAPTAYRFYSESHAEVLRPDRYRAEAEIDPQS